jgi:hypothetical protein
VSQLTELPNILAALTQDCVDAWGLVDESVELGSQRLPRETVPYALIEVLPVAIDFLEVRSVEQTYQFRITGRFAFPSSGNILLYQITQANLLIAAIITGPKYNDLAYLPIVREVSFDEFDETQEPSCEVSILFECKVRELHHPGAA